MSDWWEEASMKKYTTIDGVRGYQSKLKGKGKYEQQQEQEWVDDYLAVIINLMGNETVWNTVLTARYPYEAPILKGIGGRANSRNDRQRYSPTNVGWFSGAHWTSHHKNDAGDGYIFDPYDKYQYPGTNQFCQTWALYFLVADDNMREMMKLPRDVTDGTIEDYYTNTLNALGWIKEVISGYMTPGSFIVLPDGKEVYYTYSREDLLHIVTQELIPNYQRCFNVIELPPPSEEEEVEDTVRGDTCYFYRNNGDDACHELCYYPWFKKNECVTCPTFYIDKCDVQEPQPLRPSWSPDIKYDR